MLELPEIETLRRETEREVGGRKIGAIVADDDRLAAGTTVEDLQRCAGAKVSAVKRRNGALVWNLDNGDRLVLDIGDGAAIRRGKGDEPAAIEITFTQGGPLRVLRDVGRPTLAVVAQAQLDVVRPPSKAIDLTEQSVSWVVFARAVVGRGGPLRQLLTDPTMIERIGPLYADEILWQAGLRPDRRAERLGSQELRRLYRAVAEVLHDALKAGGTTTAGNGFTDLSGGRGGYQELLEVVGRNGQPCRRCRATVVLVRLDGKPCYRCEACQV